MKPDMIFKSKIADIIKKSKKSSATIAKESGLSQNTVMRLKKQKDITQLPAWSLVALSFSLKCKIKDLIEYEKLKSDHDKLK